MLTRSVSPRAAQVYSYGIMLSELLTGARPGIEGYLWVTGVMIAVVAIAFLLFLASGLLERGLGRTGIVVVTRLLGMLLAALAVQFVLDGLRDYGLATGLAS